MGRGRLGWLGLLLHENEVFGLNTRIRFMHVILHAAGFRE